jgi:hypothetical protein
MEVSFPKIDLPFAKFSNDPGPATPSLIPARYRHPKPPTRSPLRRAASQ